MSKHVKFATVLLAISPCLTPYLFLPGTNLATFALLLGIITMVLCNKPKKATESLELKFFITVIILSIITFLSNIGSSWFNVSTFINNFWPIFICFGTLIFASPYVNIIIFKRTLYLMAILASVIVIMQRISIITTGSFNHDVYLPFFQLAEDVAYVSRPHAFFKEPSLLAQYVIPIFYLSLLEKKYYYSLLFCLSIMSSGSTTGFLLLPIIFGVWLLMNTNGLAPKCWVLFCACLAFFIFRDYVVVLFDANMDKVDKADDDDLRLLGSWALFDAFQLNEQCLGINQLSNYFGTNKDISNYSNGILFMLISYGYIGVIALFAYLSKVYYRYKPYIGFYIILIGVFCTSQLLFSITLLYLLTFCILGKKLVTNKNT